MLLSKKALGSTLFCFAHFEYIFATPPRQSSASVAGFFALDQYNALRI